MMSVSLSGVPGPKDRSLHPGGLLKGLPSGLHASPLPGAQYLDLFAGHGLSAHGLLLHHHPLRSLGRLVTDTHAAMPVNFAGGAPPFHTGHHASVLHERILNVSSSTVPYLSHMLPGHTVYSKREELSELSVTEQFGSPGSERSSVASSASPDALFRHRAADHLSPEKTRTYSFSEDDLFTVLYGYSKNREQSAGHAISGVTLPGNSVSDSYLLSLDTETLELPEGLTILQTNCGHVFHYGVFTEKNGIAKGTRFGPFQGKLVNTSEIKTYDDNTLMWEVFENGRLSHFVDGRGAPGNWMSLVKCARFPEEQNLIAVQVQGQIFYEACKEVRAGQELLVWYGDCYVQFLGIPLTLKSSTEENHTVLPAEDSGEGFKCDRCGKVFAYMYYRDKHLKYTRCVDQGDRKFPCHLCSRSFEKRDRLRIHILHVHEKHRPHKCTVCGKSFSQSSSLNKHMRVHSGERPYKCVYCNKAFTASSILRTHIRQHSGERPFKCKHCGKAFASHAAHDSHVRRTHAKEQCGVCGVCGAVFQDAQELKHHMKNHKGRALSEGTPLQSAPVTGPDASKDASRRHNHVNGLPGQNHAGLTGQNHPGLTGQNPEYRPWN